MTSNYSRFQSNLFIHWHNFCGRWKARFGVWSDSCCDRVNKLIFDRPDALNCLRKYKLQPNGVLILCDKFMIATIRLYEYIVKIFELMNNGICTIYCPSFSTFLAANSLLRLSNYSPVFLLTTLDLMKDLVWP